MFFKFGRKKSTKAQDDHAIINSGHEHKELLTDKEVLEYFAPYADLSKLPTPRSQKRKRKDELKKLSGKEKKGREKRIFF